MRKSLIYKIMALVAMTTILVSTIPLAGLTGVFEGAVTKVFAAEIDHFDTSKLTKTSSGRFSGVAWTVYSNNLLWVEDDKSGETAYGDSNVIDGEQFKLASLTYDPNFNTELTSIKYLYIDITAPKSVSQLVYNLDAVEQIKLGDTFVNTSSNITNMSSMFYSNDCLTNIYLNGLKTSNCTNMRMMFAYCSSLKQVDVSSFDTSKVTNVSLMFYYCKSLTELNVSNFDVSNVTNFSSMFYGCNKLTKLDLSNFVTSKATNMNCMFGSCDALTTLDISRFNTSNVTDMGSMFWYCKSLSSLNLGHFSTNKVTNMYQMFYKCQALTTLDLSNFNTSIVTNMGSMFQDCISLTSVDVSSFDTGKVTNMSSIFNNCCNLESLDVSNWDVSNVETLGYAFYCCKKLKCLDLSNFDMSNVILFNNMVENGENLHILKMPKNSSATSTLSGCWYALKNDNTLDKTTLYTSIPTTGTTDVTLIREEFHTCTRHDDGTGTCTACGIKVRYGDVNDDDNINIADAVALKKYLSGYEDDNINLYTADTIADKELNINDAVKLMKYLAGINVELGLAE
ncbi:MAG: BspA family leucine-rich repeat surface protein [Lachnospira sp.]|nr:BspA family leucine-rich repeat surface protein [Lachnospira sp.]